MIDGFSQIRLAGHQGKIQLGERYPSEQIQVNLGEGEPLKIYAGNTQVSEQSPVIGKVDIPAKAKQGMVLLYSDKKKYRGHFIEKIPEGSVYLRNFSPYRVQVLVENKKIHIRPSRSYTFKPSGKENKSLKVQIKQLGKTRNGS